MPTQAKVESVEALKQRLGSARTAVVTEYRGLSVRQLSELRKQLKGAAAEYKVVKNRLAKLAIKGSVWEALQDHLKGPVAVAMTDGDPVIFSKLLTKYRESFPALKLKAGMVAGRFLALREIEALSKLPSKEELYAKLLGTLMAPAQGLVRTIQGVPQKLVVALKAIGEKKQ